MARVGAAEHDPLTRRGVPLDGELRVLALAQLVNCLGYGAVMTTSAVYFTRVVGLSAAQVALALSVSTAVGLSGQLPAGQLADTRGPRGVLVFLLGVSAAVSVLPALVRTVVALIVVLSLWNLTATAADAVRQGVIAQLAPGPRGVMFKAYLRAVTNVGIALGSLAGGTALLIDRRPAYQAVFVLDALLAALTALVVRRLPVLPAVPRQPGEPMFRAENELDILRQIRDSDLTVLERHRHQIPDDVATIVYRALAKNPDDRYASAAHMNEALETLLRHRRLAPTSLGLAATLQSLELVGARPVRKLSSLPPTERERRGGSVASVLEISPVPPIPTAPSPPSPGTASWMPSPRRSRNGMVS